MKKVIITGATGFIGGALTKKILRQGVTVYGIDIDSKRLEALKPFGNFVPVVADFSKYDKLSEMITERDFDVFYHFALSGGLEGNSIKNYELQFNNSKYACDALIAANDIGCKKFVFAGTSNEYEIENFIINNNNFSPRYTCIYSTAKLAAELICKTLSYNLGINYSVGLICISYGIGNRSRQLPNIIINNIIKKIPPKLIEGNNFYDMIYIDDIVDAFIAIGEKGQNLKSYYVGHRKLKTFREIMTEIRDILNPNVRLLFGEYKDTVNMDYSLIDLNALYNDTGFECKSDFKESILKTAEWVRSLNWDN